MLHSYRSNPSVTPIRLTSLTPHMVAVTLCPLRTESSVDNPCMMCRICRQLLFARNPSSRYSTLPSATWGKTRLYVHHVDLLSRTTFAKAVTRATLLVPRAYNPTRSVRSATLRPILRTYFLLISSGAFCQHLLLMQ